MVGKKCELGLDFHGVITNDVPMVLESLKKKFGSKYDSLVYQEGLPSPILYPERYMELIMDRRAILEDPEHLKHIVPYPGVLLAVPLLARICEGRIHMITAMEESLRGDLNELLESWDLASYLPFRHLRRKDEESPLRAKRHSAEEAGITHMVEDDPALIPAFVEADMKVIHIVNGEGRVGIPNSSNVLRYRGLYDFAIDAGLMGSIDGVFEWRREELEDPKKRFKIFEHEPLPCKDEAVFCGIREICFLNTRSPKP